MTYDMSPLQMRGDSGTAEACVVWSAVEEHTPLVNPMQAYQWRKDSLKLKFITADRLKSETISYLYLFMLFNCENLIN